MRAMSPAHQKQCRRFLAELRRTGNITLSADVAGLGRKTLRRHRLRYPAFATQWDAALGYARAMLAKAGPLPPHTSAPKTMGGEYAVRRGKNGEMQVRRAPAGRLSDAGETAFLRELAGTCNIALACRTVGISPSNILRRRQRSDQFADRMDAALAQGHERLEFALMEAALCSTAPDEMAGIWEELGVDAPSPLTTMSFDQVIISMGLHRKRVVLGEKRRSPHRRDTTAEETDAAITAILDRMRKRKKALEKRDWETGEPQAAEGGEVVVGGLTPQLPVRGEVAAGPEAAGASAKVADFG